MSVDADKETPAEISAPVPPPRQPQIPPLIGAPIPTYEEPMPINTKPPVISNRVAAAPVQPIATYVSRDVTAPNTGGGLPNFDLSKFEFSSPASWEALGTAWNMSNGYFPSQEELMKFVMSAMAGVQAGGGNQWQNNGGRSEPVAQKSWNHGSADAAAYASIDTWDVTTRAQPVQNQEVSPNQDESDQPVLVDGSVGLSGKMKRVGDRWVFVRA